MSASISTGPFDRHMLALRRARADKAAPGHRFLQERTARELLERLGLVKRNFKDVVFLGHMPGETCEDIPENEILPYPEQSCDLVMSNFNLHHVNDLPGLLIQIRRSLKPDGLFIAAMPGGETLHELRHVLSETENALKGGMSPRVFPFADKPQMGALMQRAGFALPVVDSQILTVTYVDIFKLMHDLRFMGENNIIAARNKGYVGRDFFAQANKLYKELFSDQDQRIEASFEIIYLIGWAPHESQQKPLKRGSATHSLDEFLNHE